MRATLLLLLLISCQLPAATVFEIRDPVGDDHGSGDLLYPNRGDLQPGDLDIVSFAAENEAGGTWFQAEFRNPIRTPQSEVTEVGQVPMPRLARNGFYSFNIDIYIDQDLEPGSGLTEALPGRKVRIDAATAWEKTVLLTPRPDIARSMLASHLERIREQELRAEQGRVTGDDRERIAAAVEQTLTERYFMPNRVRVRRRVIRFFVPEEFLGGPASRDWAYTVLITGAEVEQTTRLATAPENFLLMNLPVERGLNFRNFGLRGDADADQPPVVDYVMPRAGWQRIRLSDYNVARGLYASVVGTVPSGRPLDVKPRAYEDTAQPPAAEERSRAEAPPREADRGEAEPIPTGDSLADQLRAIRELRDQGLLTEEEYQTIRRRLLAEY
ncbi:MAG: glucodextranase DOMON-like domain-containing protein [Gammaproteobacteria bacterium]